MSLAPTRLLPNGDVSYPGRSITVTRRFSTRRRIRNTGGGTWTAGPTVPGGYVSDDAAGVVLPDGQFLFSADQPNYTFSDPHL